MPRTLLASFVYLFLLSSNAFAAVPSDEEVKAAFDKGRQLYNSGQVEEALKIWKEIAPYSKDEVTVLGLIASVEAKVKDTSQAQAAAEMAKTESEKKPEAPAELTAFLKTANERLQSQIDAAGAIESDAASRIATSQGFISQKTDEGKRLATAGQYTEAVAQWREVVPYFSDGAALVNELDLLEKNAATARLSRSSVEETLARRDQKPAIPADTRQFISNKIRDLMQESLAAETKQSEILIASSNRREKARAGLLSARGLYENGQIPEAIAQWREVAPEFSDGESLLTDLTRLEQSFNKSTAAWDAMKKADEEAKRRLDPSEELKLVIHQARQKLDAEVASAKVETIAIKKTAGIQQTAQEARVPLDEVDKLMLDFNVTTMDELEKRYQARGISDDKSVRTRKKFLGIL